VGIRSSLGLLVLGNVSGGAVEPAYKFWRTTVTLRLGLYSPRLAIFK